MSRLQLFCLAVVALFGVIQAQCYGRVPFRSIPPVPRYAEPFYCPGADDLNALLLLAKALDKPSSSADVNSNEIINKLLDALIFTTTTCAPGTPGAPGAPGVPGRPGKPGLPGAPGKPTKPAERDPALIDLGLLTGDDLLNLILAGQDILRLDLGQGGGALTGLVNGLV